MMTLVLALLCAASAGAADFLGGLISRREVVWRVVFVSQGATAFLSLVLAVLIGGTAQVSDLLAGCLGGVATALGIVMLYRGLATGQMGRVITTSAVGTALVPLATGMVQGERVSALAACGIVCGGLSSWLASQTDLPPASDLRRTDTRAILYGFGSGVGFGVLFAVMGTTSADSKLYPMAAAYICSWLVIFVTAWRRIGPAVLPVRRRDLVPVCIAPFAWTAVASFHFASRDAAMTEVAPIAALFPITTTILAGVVIGERIGRSGWGGIALAVACVVLVGIG